MLKILRIVAFAAGCLMTCAAVDIANATEVPAAHMQQEVKAAAELLNVWSGDSQVLEQARQKLAQVLEVEPKNYLALKEMARYQLMDGYINSRYVRYKGHPYEVGNYSPGTLERSEATIREAIRINPRYAEGYVFLGYVQFEQTNLNASDISLSYAETLGTDDPWLQLNWATLNLARGEDAAAVVRYQRVLKSGTSNRKALMAAYDFLIENYKLAGDHDKAVALYQDQIKRNPDNAWMRGNFAEYLSVTLGRNDEAITQARAALNIMNYGMGRRILAGALYRKWADMVMHGQDAERYFQEAFQIDPDLNDMMLYAASGPMGGQLAAALSTKKGVSINARGDGGSTTLLIATNRNQAVLVKAFLELNANPNLADQNGWTPLLSAADEGNTEIVSMLLAKGADPHATIQGRSAAVLAAQKGKPQLAVLLINAAANSK